MFCNLLLDNFKNISNKFESYLENCFRNPCQSTLPNILSCQEFNLLVDNFMPYENFAKFHINVTYLKSVFTILALVSAVCEVDIERHIQAELQIVDHPNYARYGTYHPTLLKHLCHASHPAYHDLLVKDYGLRITGERFSTAHGDILTEIFHKETKGGSCPFQSEFSTNIDTVSTWVNTSHIYSKLCLALHQQLLLKPCPNIKKESLQR